MHLLQGGRAVIHKIIVLLFITCQGVLLDPLEVYPFSAAKLLHLLQFFRTCLLGNHHIQFQREPGGKGRIDACKNF